MLLHYEESKSTQTIVVRKPSIGYLDELCRLRCGGDLLEMDVFPNAKEITESFGAYEAVWRYLDVDRNDPDVHVYCVGDGTTPRTGATFAYRSRWTVESIDPAMGWKLKWAGIKRLRVQPYKVEQLGLAPRPRRSIIVAVHSHANLQACVRILRGEHQTDVVAMECCVPLALHRRPDVEYEDPKILSPKRKIAIWRRV